MTKADIIDEVAAATGLTKVETEAALDGVIQSISEVLETHELIKIKFYKNKDLKENISKKIISSTKSTKVSIIGNTLIIYKQSSNPKYRQIKL